MEKITTTELMNVLANVKGGEIVNLTSLTEIEVPYFGIVRKWCKQNIQIGSSYENSVNNRLAKLGMSRNFRTSGLRWGRWHIANRIITHNGNYYARFFKIPNANAKVMYFINGRQANIFETVIIRRYDNGRGVYSARQARYGLTDGQTQVRCYDIKHILALSADGKTYEVVKQTATRNA